MGKSRKRTEPVDAAGGDRIYADIDLSLIDASPYQARHWPDDDAWADQEDTRALVASIRAGGVEVPVRLRPSPVSAGRYELIDGERRARASRLAGRKSVPAIVSTLDDAGAAALACLANRFRAELSPWEEVDAVRAALEACPAAVETIAAKLGQTVRWVRLRARVAALPTAWRDATTSGHLENWELAHLDEIARLDADTIATLKPIGNTKSPRFPAPSPA